MKLIFRNNGVIRETKTTVTIAIIATPAVAAGCEGLWVGGQGSRLP